MKKTLRRVAIGIGAAAVLSLPVIASAYGIVGDCSDCHTMHNSKDGQAVALKGTTGVTTATPNQNLLKMDCIACHANPSATGPTVTLSGGSIVPQVYWNDAANVDNSAADITADLAGGNFWYTNHGANGQEKGHNVIDLAPADAHNAGTNSGAGTATYGAPPGMAETTHHPTKFDTDYGVSGGTNNTPYGAFTCAGARGCHGTRSQALSGGTADWDNNASTPNNWEGVRRTGIAAISGAHHNSYDGPKTSNGYTAPQVHSGQMVADGYRFIPGLKGMGNIANGGADRWRNLSASSHNEYYADVTDSVGEAPVDGCDTCHNEDASSNGIDNSNRATLASNMKVPGNDMSGFCSTCHGVFHSSGVGNDNNGTSGAFLRHPSDWTIPNTGEYAAYTTYNVTAPVARTAVASAVDSSVHPGSDAVMCLSCHEAHGSPFDFMLRFDYTYDGTGTMQAGAYASIASATSEGGCLACHTTKGVLPENR